jgi:hypothetical protein
MIKAHGEKTCLEELKKVNAKSSCLSSSTVLCRKCTSVKLFSFPKNRKSGRLAHEPALPEINMACANN